MELSITKPDDWHLHLRDGEALKTTVQHTARCFARAIIMPNLSPPITTCSAAAQYKKRIIEAIPKGARFNPLMTLYLTDKTTPEEIKKASESDFIYAAKLYPAGATTNSSAGVTDIKKIDIVLNAMTQHRLPLLVHGEITDASIDIFDREKVFIEKILEPLSRQHPDLKIVMEHITTRDAAAFVKQSSANIAATITAHHLLLNRNSIFVGGIKPHYYCLPVLKRETHREALVAAATSNDPSFFLGTDSAPHGQHDKESACGCAGIYTAHAAIELYAHVFSDAGALDKLESFASFHGADFYGLERNKEKITLIRQPWTIPKTYPLGDKTLIPFYAGQPLNWSVKSNEV